MDFRLTEEQRALRDGTRELLAKRFGRERLRAAVDAPGLDRALWRELGGAGFFALRLPERAGGVGLGLPEAVLVLEEAGRALLPGPLVACQLLAGAVDGVAAGERIVALCEAERDPVLWEHPGDCDELILVEGGAGRGGAGPGGGSGDGPGGALRGAQGRTGGACRSAADRIARAPFTSLDPLTPLARVTDLRRTAPLALDVPRLRREAALLTAAQQLGSAVRTVEMAVGHAREREQFGVPIGTFQAIKHLCAQMLVRAEIARSAVYAAAVTERADEVTAAKLLADEAAVRNARDCLQVHGGMGFTWDVDVHLHLKRAWLRAERWGSAREAEELLADGLLA
ncbi:acyl-CoA dehydrogenase family protein [Streptomyces angustmyceticus]|uniref:Acyl-CoA dehydrogenase n=2 Tax=Streptomyces angustmyceticus TaxID=285578 RepID=A0A5J4LIB0_9ACTN|nr:acyl-CoA dehydrogenase family protein [Streptomyces angustmyceticus]UAL68625.1 acyl-CoA/acyl-ACP dehydrogenase [Streptomyces angustmyceticus]GES33937.1 acyl-CoA dehydrogenase [Streptomyces angustmyceticus]